MAAGDCVRRHETDIVTVVGIFRARIAEACKDKHRLLRAGKSYFSSAAGAASGAATSVVSSASGFIADEPAMVAIVKSRSEITGFTPAGSLTDEMWIESPMLAPVRSIVMNSGIALVGQWNSTS